MKKLQPILLLFILISSVNLISEKNVEWRRAGYSSALDFISEQEQRAKNLKKLIPNAQEASFISKEDVLFDSKQGDFIPTYLLLQYIFSPLILRNNDESSKYIIEYCENKCENLPENKLLAKSGNYHLYVKMLRE